MSQLVENKNSRSQSSTSPIIFPNAPSQSLHSNPENPESPFVAVARMMTPLASPVKKAISGMQTCLVEVGHITKLDPQDSWLPITESRNGNACYAAFHTLSSGIGFQSLVLPLAFTALGWVWGIVCLCLGFIWQLYTLWLLIQLHESVTGTRYSRYLRLSMAAFGEKLGKFLALFPTLYLAGGTCVSLIMIGGDTLKIFFHTVCGTTCNANSLSTFEWYLIFVCIAVILAQLPNLNSIAGVSLIGAITAVTYCTLTWAMSISKTKPFGVSYEPMEMQSEMSKICGVLNALGIIAFAFRGHNLVLEIQVPIPIPSLITVAILFCGQPETSYSIKKLVWHISGGGYNAFESKEPVASANVERGEVFILDHACCLFPMAIGGYWAYGNLIPANGGMLSALDKYHRNDISRAILGLTSLFVVINSLTSFQIYAMPVFDNLEFRYTSNKNGPCPWWLRTGLRIFFGCLAFFISVALPFLKDLAGLLGGIALPLTLAYPCLMWIRIKKPQKYTGMWCLNWLLGSLGMVLSVLLVFGAIWTIATQGIEVHFFKPQ